MTKQKGETARTPEPHDGDAPEDTEQTGTETQDERDAGREAEDLQQQHTQLNMEWKGKAESLNSLLSKHGVKSVEELEEKLAQPPAAPDDVVQDDEDDEAEEAAIRQFAARGDPVAKRVLKEIAARRRLERGIGDAFVANTITDEQLRIKAARHYERNRHRLGDFRAALAEVREAEYEKQNKELRERLERLEKPPDPDVVKAPKTQGREVTATERRERKMKESDFDSKVAALKAQGDHRGAMKLQRQLRNDEIELEWGR